MNRRPSARAFTLIELLVVMAIVALLLTIALPRFQGSLDKSREVVLRENLKVIRVALDQFTADKGRYPQALEDLVDGRYLREMPVDPITESARTWTLVPSQDQAQVGVVDVRSGAAGTASTGQPYETF